MFGSTVSGGLAKATVAALLVVGVLGGSATAASAATPATTTSVSVTAASSVSSAQIAPVLKGNNGAAKTWAFVQCVVGTGVPIGVAIAAIGNPAVLGAIVRMGTLPVGAGAAVSKYFSYMVKTCRLALF